MLGVKEQTVQAESAQTSLTARVRTLYEGSAVPVREIARLAGVTERTIYKYAAKQQWKPRYAWTADGTRPRGWRAEARFAPAKGAGGRFIRRVDKDNPIAVGLKAIDRQGAAGADAACRRAQALARRAQAAAELDRRAEVRLRAMNTVNQALDQFAWHRARRPARPTPIDHAIEHALHSMVDTALDWWRQAGAEETAARARMRRTR